MYLIKMYCAQNGQSTLITQSITQNISVTMTYSGFLHTQNRINELVALEM